MTSAGDEAFVRSVVASPGDDGPRLIYADWLDERGDPRGAYLRDEASWYAKGRGRSALKARAAGLDPVWLARVSRPPFGVCCDHLLKSDRGDQATDAEIDADAAELDIRVPPQLRALLRNYSLGFLRGGPFEAYRADDGRQRFADAFVCLTDPDLDDEVVSAELVDRTQYLREEERLNAQYLFLAGTFDSVAYVVRAARPSCGAVYLFCEWNGDSENSAPELTKVSGSVGEFLYSLKPRTYPLQ